MRRINRSLCVALGSIGIATGLVMSLTPANAVVGGKLATKLGPNIAFPGCSGALLSREWAITAFHCVEGEDINAIVGLAGNLDQRKGTRVSVSEVQHEGDIALLRLTDLPPEISKFAKIGNAEPPVGARVSFFGWGVKRFDGGPISPLLKTGTAKVTTPFANGRGDAYGGPSWTVKNNGKGGVAPGDSGGSAFFKGKLVGVVSNGDKVGANFASVPAHRPWIKAVTGR